MPKIGLPVTLSSVSRRFCGVPTSVQSCGSLSFGSAGGGDFAAASATSPKRRVRPLGLWVMTLFAACHSTVGTFHCCAAAAISISRAAAPAFRKHSCEPRTEQLAPVDMSPHAR
jgi:hypothetical protein